VAAAITRARMALSASGCDINLSVDQSEHYYQLVLLGEEQFLASAAPAALVRGQLSSAAAAQIDEDSNDTMVASLDGALGKASGPSSSLEVFALAKKPGAPFADMITIGRTPNNDVVIRHITVSRFHSFFRQRDGGWTVSDAGSKNGTYLEGRRLEARKERPVASGHRVRMGDIEATFYSASDLFNVLSGTR
jgi:hypothetical protein